MKHFFAWLMVCFLVFTPNIVSNNSNYFIDNKIEKSSKHTVPTGIKIYDSSYWYSPETGKGEVEYELVFGQGKENETANTLVNAAVTTSSRTPSDETSWSSLSSIISTSYSATGRWTVSGSTTYEDPDGNGSTNTYKGTIGLKNIPESLDDDYYLIVQGRSRKSSSISTYTTYDVVPLSFSSLKDPSKKSFSQVEADGTTATLEFKYNQGNDPYDDPWLIDKNSTNVVITNLSAKSNYTIDYDTNNGIVTLNLTDLEPNNEYKVELTLKFINPVNSKDIVTLKDQISFNTTLAPTIVSTQVSEIKSDSVKVSWDITDTTNMMSSIKIVGTDVDQDVTSIGLQGETTIEDLTPQTEYNDWKLIVGYEADSLSIEKSIDPFTTTFDVPIIKSVKVSKNGLDSVKVSWDIEDVSNSVTLIQIIGTDVDQDVTAIGLQGETIVESLDTNKTYDDWKLVVTYNDSEVKTIEQSIDAFSIVQLNEEKEEGIFPWWWIVLAIILLWLAIIGAVALVIWLGWKSNQDSKKSDSKKSDKKESNVKEQTSKKTDAKTQSKKKSDENKVDAKKAGTKEQSKKKIDGDKLEAKKPATKTTNKPKPANKTTSKTSATKKTDSKK